MTIVSKIVPERGSEGEEQKRKKKKRSPRGSLCTTFLDMYKLTGESLGQGSYGKVETCVNVFTGQEYAVKIIQKVVGLFNRSKLLQEIELYYLCQGKDNIIQLVEFFDESDCFFLVFEKMEGGPLLSQIQRRGRLTEAEAARIITDLAKALSHLHSLGVAHRDIKPDNVLCVNPNSPFPVKLCDFDLCSPTITVTGSMTPAMLSPVGSLEFMAPEVVAAFLVDDHYDEEESVGVTYTKACDLWSLGVLLYILLSGCPPFTASHCPVPDCGWDQGAPCTHCQTSLLSSIQEDTLSFPTSLWAGVSSEAISLVRGLLVREERERLTADQVLQHPWLVKYRGVEEGEGETLDTLSPHSLAPCSMVERRAEGSIYSHCNMRAIA